MNSATTAPQLPPGTVIDGTYTTGAVVRSRLGAVTYAATDLSSSRVDVTVYAPECFVSPVAMERSLRELRQLEKVHVPQVLRIIDAGKLPQGGIYEVHEHTGARPLAELGAIPASEVGPLIREVVAALQAAQKVGVLHRNLGAEAILRDERGIKVSGFAVGDPQGGVSFGSLDCIAPEQVEGKNIDERTLVYNLAALTYRFLRGASLFTGGDNGTRLLQAAASLPPPESMPAPLFSALAKDPKARPNLLARFLGDLDAIVRDFNSDFNSDFDRDSDRDFDAAGHSPSASASTRAAAPPAPNAAMRDLEQIAATSKASEERDVSDTLTGLMTDPDAPKLPSSDPQAGSAAAAGNTALPKTDRPGTIPPRPAIITGPGTLGAPPTLGAPKPTPSLGASVPALGGLPNAPSLGSLGKGTVPPIAAPPGLPGLPGLPGAGRPPPTIGAPPTLAPPSFGAPPTPPGVSPPTLTSANFGAPSAAPVAAAAPANAASSGSAAAPSSKPRTRGWTMFMEVTEDEAGGPGGGVPLPGGGPATAPATAQAPAPATVQAPAPALTPAPAPVSAAAPAPGTPGEVKPSTRGWTMIMDDPAEADPAALGLATPAASPPPPSPTTRGWTMLEELNDSLPAAAVAATAAAAVAATPTGPASTGEASIGGGAPSSRGWTMFMEAELQGGAKPEEAQPAEVEPEFYDGQVQTDSGTVVAFAPTAADPNGVRARQEPAPPASPDFAAQEPMRSFGSRLRGADDAPAAPSLSAESAPSVSAEIPSFAGNKLGNVAVGPVAPVTPATPMSAPSPEAQPDDLEQLDTASGSNTKLIVIGLVVVVIVVVAIIMATGGNN